MLNQTERILKKFEESKKERLIVLTENGEAAKEIARQANNRKIIIFETTDENNTELLLNKVRIFREDETMICIDEKHKEYESAKKIKEDGFQIEILDATL